MADTTVGLDFETVPVPAAEGYARSSGTQDLDKALIQGLRNGEESAYEDLIQTYEKPLYALVYRLVDDPSEAADVVQEVFLKVFCKIDSFRGNSSLKTWLYRIAVNQARNQQRWFVRHRKKEVGLDSSPERELSPAEWLSDSAPSPFDVTLEHESVAQIEAALRQVNVAFRAALVLREVEGLSYEEVATILDISLGTVKSRIMRGREALRKILQTSTLQEAITAQPEIGVGVFGEQGCEIL